jgi:RNA polymerase sigma factor (TIGR02999 family)
MSERVNLTELIHRAQEGDAEAADALFAATYHDLRGLAKARLYGSGPRATLDTLSLVHESYLRFTASGQLRLEDRVHFMRWAGRVMRSVIVDFARRRNAERRGGHVDRVTLTERRMITLQPPVTTSPLAEPAATRRQEGRSTRRVDQ